MAICTLFDFANSNKCFCLSFYHDSLPSLDHFRPVTQTGRPLTGFVRPGTQAGRPGSIEQALKTPRTAHTARPMTSASGRYVRLGTVRILCFYSWKLELHVYRIGGLLLPPPPYSFFSLLSY